MFQEDIGLVRKIVREEIEAAIKVLLAAAKAPVKTAVPFIKEPIFKPTAEVVTPKPVAVKPPIKKKK